MCNFICNSLNINKYKGKDAFFTRKKILSFQTITLLILNGFKQSVHFSLEKILPTLNLPIVTASAFSQARKKIKFEFFKDIAKVLSGHFLEQNSLLWKGYRLIACDGSTCLVPTSKDNISYFGAHSKSQTGTSTCLAQLIVCYDVLANFIIDSTIGTLSEGEQLLFRGLLPTIGNVGKSIFILDRGYGYWAMYKILINNKFNFCIRQSSISSTFSKIAMENLSMDFITDWFPTNAICKKENFIQGESIKVRITKIVLNTGEIELLISNLFDFDLISTEEMGELYFKRWSVEEAIKRLKPQMGLEQFGSKKPNGIKQEFWATIIQFNIISKIGMDAQKEIDNETEFKKTTLKTPTNTKRKYKYNSQTATSLIREKYIQLLLYKEFMINDIRNLIDKIKRSICAIRPGRSYPRSKTKIKPHKHTCYKS